MADYSLLEALLGQRPRRSLMDPPDPDARTAGEERTRGIGTNRSARQYPIERWKTPQPGNSHRCPARARMRWRIAFQSAG